MEALYILDGVVTFFPEDVQQNMEYGRRRYQSHDHIQTNIIDADTKISNAEIILDIEEGGKRRG